MSYFTSLLYATPSFIEGIARIFDFGTTLQEYNLDITDEQALAADWYAIGEDMRRVAGLPKQLTGHESDYVDLPLFAG